MKMDPPPDADKNPLPPDPADNSCWMATAANMLAGAGYGDGTTVQARADDIYGDMIAQYGTADRGWPDAAIQWWLGSANNTWTNNPYTVLTVLGTKGTPILVNGQQEWNSDPWTDADAPEVVGNELRRCQFVGLAFSWPTDAQYPNGVPVVGFGGHATTAWGDELGKGTISVNPSTIRMTDSDRDTGGEDVQVYSWDAFTNPNPGGANEGNGWYFDYFDIHPYLRCAITLCPTDDPSDDKNTQIVVGSMKIHQDQKAAATDLHYRVGTDVRILSYKTEIDWGHDEPPSITENQDPRTELTVDWDLREKPVPYCEWVKITTEFVLPTYNGVKYRDVHFTYPATTPVVIPDLDWEVRTRAAEFEERIPQDVTGGYVIGTFDVLDAEGETRIAEYRFVHQYGYLQDPEYHEFILKGTEGYRIANLRFGHSYGLLRGDELWKFERWMSRAEGPLELTKRGFITKLDWEGRLPYPKGIDVRDVWKFVLEDRERKK